MRIINIDLNLMSKLNCKMSLVVRLETTTAFNNKPIRK